MQIRETAAKQLPTSINTPLSRGWGLSEVWFELIWGCPKIFIPTYCFLFINALYFFPKLSPVMTPDELLSLADNPRFIPGIYNYCDRWCERCPVTHQCMLFASSSEEEALPEDASEEERQQAFVQQIEASCKLTIELLHKLATEEGIDLDALVKQEDESNPRPGISDLHDEIKKQPLSQLSYKYLKRSHEWLQNFGDKAIAKEIELQQALDLQLPDRDPEQEVRDIKDAIEVINWYHFQINVKLSRAQMSRWDNDEDFVDDDGKPYPKDSDGSAKVALIGIERSIGAWGLLLRQFPDQEESILKFLSMLMRLLRMTEAEFPDARSFCRPGLDEFGRN